LPEQIIDDCEIHPPLESWYDNGYNDLKDEMSLVQEYLRQNKAMANWPIRLAHGDEPSRIAWLVSEINEAIRESGLAGATPVDEDTKRMAIKFAAILPTSLPIPEIGFDPDGEISFDWLGPSNKILSVSVDRHGRLAYAGRFGERQKINGVEQLSENCPPEIIRGIKRAAVQGA
jgi:hypothetical protein